MSVVVPIKKISKDFPEAGRIRLGVKATSKAGKEYPKAIDTFRLTSQYRQPIEQAAELWGGEVQPWNGEWEVVTQTNTMDIIIPMVEGFDPLGGTPIYELWSGGGCTRRCDGETVETPEVTAPDTVEMVSSPCICERKQIMECSPKLRLIIGLPDLDFYGFWRLETGSMNAIRENQGMLDAIATLQSAGIQRGVLTLERREIKKPGAKTKKFVVPLLRLAGSMNELAAGTTALGALAPAPQRPELSSPDGGDAGFGSSRPDPASSSEVGAVAGEGAAPASEVPPEDDDVVDAEIIDDGPDETPQESGEAQEGFVLEPAERARYRSAFMARIKGLGLPYETQVRPWLQTKYETSGGWSELDDSQAYNLYRALIVPDGTRQEKDDAAERFRAVVQEHAEAAA